MINVSQPFLGSEELEAVRKVFESNWTGKGKITAQFEAQFARHIGLDPELIRSVNSGTEGLFHSMSLLGIGPGDEVIVPTLTFVSAGNAVMACGARPVFCDVDPRSLNCTAEEVERRITARTKAVMIVHYGGVPCDMAALCEVVKRRGILLIEDNACSVASRFRGQSCGTFGDLSVWSFDSMKGLVSGDGGMIACGTSERARHAERLMYLGLAGPVGIQKEAEERWWEFDVACTGRRSIMNDIASAIGIEQLKKLPSFLARRKEIHEIYNRELADIGGLMRPPENLPEFMSSYYFYWVQIQPGRRDRLASHLRRNGIYSTFYYFPLHRIPLYGSASCLPNAERAAEETLCLPMHPSLSNGDLDHILDAIRRFDT